MGVRDLIFGKKRRELQEQKQEIDKAWAKLKEFTADNQYALQVLSQIALHNGIPAFSYDLAKFINTGYVKNPNVYSIVNKILQPAKDIPWLVYRVKDRLALKRYQAFKADGYKIEAQKYASKALELVEGTPLNRLFEDRANQLHTWPEFVEQSLGYKLLAGNDFIYEFSPVGFKYPTELYVLPAPAIEIIPGPLHQHVKGYKMVFNHNEKYFEPDTIIHRKTFNPTFNFGAKQEDYLYGLSPLAPLCRTVETSNQSIDAMLAMFLNGGPPGILSQDTSGTDGNPMKGGEIEKMQEGWRRNYGGGKKANMPVFAPIKLDFVALGASMVDLQLIESDEAMLKKICGVFNVPLALVLMDSATLDNMKVSEKQLYIKAILPALTDLRESLNKGPVAKVNTATGIEYWVDYDVKSIPVLQEDKEQISKIMMTGMEHGAYSPNEYREAMGDDVISGDPYMDKRMIKTTLRWTDEPLPSNQSQSPKPEEDEPAES